MNALTQMPFQALNPEEKLKKGQKFVLTCAIHAKGVAKRDIVWFKDGKKVTKGVSSNK